MDKDTLPIVNAIQNLKSSNTDDRERLQKSLRAGLLNVVKSVDRLNASIISSLSSVQPTNPFEGNINGAPVDNSAERTSATLAEFSQIAQAYLQFGTRENTGQQARFSEMVEEQTEVMARSSMGQTKLFGIMGEMLGQMNAKLADIAAHGLRQLQYQKLMLDNFPDSSLQTQVSAIAQQMKSTIEKTLIRQNENVGYSETLLSNLHQAVAEVNETLGVAAQNTQGLTQVQQEATEVEVKAEKENTQAIEENTKVTKKAIQSENMFMGWFGKLHGVIKKDLIENLKDMKKLFRGGVMPGSLIGGGIGALFGGPVGAGVGALLGGGVGGVFSMIASRAAMGVLMNPYVLAAVTTATAGYFGLEQFKRDLKERMEANPGETGLVAGTQVVGDYASKATGYLGKSLDWWNEKLFGETAPVFEPFLESTTRATFDALAENLGKIEAWWNQNIKLYNPFSSQDGVERGWLGNYWENLKRDLNQIESAIKEWLLGELEAVRSGLKTAWNESFLSDLTGLYFRKSEKQIEKENQLKDLSESDVPAVPMTEIGKYFSPVDQKAPAYLINDQSRQQLLELARKNFSPNPNRGGDGGVVNNMFDNRSSNQFFQDVKAGKENSSTVSDPWSNLNGNYNIMP